MSSPSPPLVTLPPELLHQILGYLLPQEVEIEDCSKAREDDTIEVIRCRVKPEQGDASLHPLATFRALIRTGNSVLANTTTFLLYTTARFTLQEGWFTPMAFLDYSSLGKNLQHIRRLKMVHMGQVPG
jgi:hypothetical protein